MWEMTAHPQAKLIRGTLSNRTQSRLIYRLQALFTVNCSLESIGYKKISHNSGLQMADRQQQISMLIWEIKCIPKAEMVRSTRFCKRHLHAPEMVFALLYGPRDPLVSLAEENAAIDIYIRPIDERSCLGR